MIPIKFSLILKMENKDVIDHLKKYWIFLQEIVKFNS